MRNRTGPQRVGPIPELIEDKTRQGVLPEVASGRARAPARKRTTIAPMVAIRMLSVLKPSTEPTLSTESRMNRRGDRRRCEDDHHDEALVYPILRGQEAGHCADHDPCSVPERCRLGSSPFAGGPRFGACRTIQRPH